MEEKENKRCRSCKWYSDGVCCNGDSAFRAEFRWEYQICDEWEGDTDGSKQGKVKRIR